MYWLHVVSLSVFGLLNCASSLQSLFVLRFVGIRNMANGFAILQFFTGVSTVVVPLVIEALVGHYGMAFDTVYYIGAAVVCSLSPILMGITHWCY